jgi:hypothetical protein
MAAFAQDLRFAFRQLKKSPGFTVTVVMTLALGIGATTAVFSLVECVLLRPLPFSDPDRLVLMGDHLGEGAGLSVTAREIDAYARATSTFSAVGGYISINYELSSGAIPEEVYAARFSAGVFPTLGVSPVLGRVFSQQEDDGHEPVAVISDALWTNRYHRDPAVLGKSIVLDRKVYSVIGVMPRSFEFPLQAGHLDQAQLWVPLSLTPDELADQHLGFWGYEMVARLKDGVTLTQAAGDAERVSRQVMGTFPASMAGSRVRHRRCSAIAEDAVHGCFCGVAHCLREHCGIAVGARDSTPSRIRCETGSGGAFRGHRTPVRIRRTADQPRRRIARPGVCGACGSDRIASAAGVDAAGRLDFD